MKHVWLIALLSLITFGQLSAQIRLKTPEGRTVLLFDNGTWKYEEEKKIDKEHKPAVPVKTDAELSKPFVLIDAELEFQTVIKGESEKLSKFSKTENIVKSDFQLISKNGKVILKTNWKIMDAEGFRFFGYITKKSKIILKLSNNETVILQYNSDFPPKEYPKYKFSTFTAELELNEEQIRKLQRGYIQKADMYWSRRTESYSVFDPDYFIKELPKIME